MSQGAPHHSAPASSTPTTAAIIRLCAMATDACRPHLRKHVTIWKLSCRQRVLLCFSFRPYRPVHVAHCAWSGMKLAHEQRSHLPNAQFLPSLIASFRFPMRDTHARYNRSWSM